MADAALELVDFQSQLTATRYEQPSQFGDQSGLTFKATVDLVKNAHAPQSSRPWLDAQLQLVEMPAEATLYSNSLTNQVLAVVNEETNLPLRSVQSGHWQVRLPQHRTRHCQRINRVRFPLLAHGPPVGRHHVRRDSDY